MNPDKDEVIATWTNMGYPKLDEVADHFGVTYSWVSNVLTEHLSDESSKRDHQTREKKRLLALLEGYIFQLQQANVGESTQTEISAIKTNYNRIKEQYDKLNGTR